MTAQTQGGFRRLAGPVLGGATVGVLGMLTFLLALDSPPKDPQPFTEWGAFLYVPERDIPVYLAGVALTLVLIAVLGRLALSRPTAPGPPRRSAVWTALYQIAGIALVGVVFLDRFLSVRTEVLGGSPVPGSFFVLFVVSVGSILAMVLLAHRLPAPGGRDVDGVVPTGGEDRKAPGPSPLDALVILLLVAVVYLYGWRDLAGELLLQEGLVHWDYFALGPTLSFSRGLALGLDVYSAYGVGWPMLFAALNPVLEVSPGRMLQIGSIYACLYLAGFYVLLRLLVRRRGWAVLGTTLAVLTLFFDLGELVIWRFPSLTMMRWPMDVWCFLAVVMHLRTRQRVWAVAGGAACGLAVVFVTDTGLYLGAAFAFYWATAAALPGDRRRLLGDFVFAGLAAVTTLLGGLAVAGRGQLLTPDFWLGWLETVLEFVGGIGMLPLATIPSVQTLLTFVAALLVYLAVAGHTLARIWGGVARPWDAFAGFVSVYGVFLLIHFVGRSGDGTPPRLIIPALLLITVSLSRVNEKAIAADLRWAGSRGLAFGLTVLIVFASLWGPESLLRQPFGEYPNVFNALDDGAGGDDLCLLRQPRDLCDLPEELRPTADIFHALIDRMKNWEERGITYAVLDETGSLFYLETQSPPWGRYSLVFTSLHTKEQVDDLVRRLERLAPRYVLTRRPQGLGMEIYDRWPISPFGFGPREDSIFWDSWVRVRAAIGEHYRLASSPEPYEIWVRTGAGNAEKG